MRFAGSLSVPVTLPINPLKPPNDLTLSTYRTPAPYVGEKQCNTMRRSDYLRLSLSPVQRVEQWYMKVYKQLSVGYASESRQVQVKALNEGPECQ